MHQCVDDMVKTISNTCKRCSKCEFDRSNNAKAPIQYLPIAIHVFHIISVGWFDLKSEKFLLIADWYSGFFDDNDPVPNFNAALSISGSRE